MTQAAQQKLSILHTEWSDGWGGQERRIISEMIGMKARGHRMILVCRDDAQILEKAMDAGLEAFTLPFAGKFDLRTIMPLVQMIRSEKIDLVNTHSGKDSWAGGLAAYYSSTPLVRTRHLNIPLQRSWHNFIHKLPAAIVTCGERMRTQLIQNGFPESQLVNIPTGIDFEQFTPKQSREAVRAALNIPQHAKVVLMTGIVRAVKRHELALRVWQELLKTYPDAVLLIAGDGPLRHDMEKLAQTLGIAGQVQFLRHREDIPDLMQAADFALLTSRSEGVPQAVTQALGMGLPTVATHVGGVSELIIDEQTGLLAPAEDQAAILAQLLRLFADADLASKLAAGGQHHVQQNFSAQVMLDRTESLAYRVVNEHRHQLAHRIRPSEK